MALYTSEEDTFIIENYGKIPADKIAKELNRSKSSVYTRARALKLTKKTPRVGNLSGKTFGMLKVLKPLETTRNGHKRYLCECSCGCEKQVLATHLVSGKIRSCGCLNKKTGSEHFNFDGYGEIHRSIYNAYKNSATNRYKHQTRKKIPFEFSIEYLWGLFLDQDRKCNISGIEIYFGQKNNSDKTASLDRIDSSKGYIEGNVQWVHKDVNMMKRTFDQDYFIDLCKKIAYNNRNEEI